MARDHVAALLVVGLCLGASTAGAEDKASLVVEVQGLHSDKGKVGCQVFSSGDGFPGDTTKAVKRLFVDISGGRATCDFGELPPGDYAVGAFHDENGNGKLDTGFLGIPKEGVGASRDAKGTLGPPKFADAHFPVAGPTRQVIHISY